MITGVDVVGTARAPAGVRRRGAFVFDTDVIGNSNRSHEYGNARGAPERACARSPATLG